jgi:uncharacterized protein (DUF2236 family)
VTLEKKYRVQRERDFKPHQILLDAARTALEDAEIKMPGYLYRELAAITFSALALEALTNSFGEKLVMRWEDFEKATPIAKIRIICSQLRLEPDFEKEPWAAALWLVKFRNRIAHAKPESIKFDKTMTDEEFQQIRFEYPHSKLEMEISLANAKRSVSAVDQMLESFYPKLTDEQKYHLYLDGFTGSTSIC